MSGVLDWGGAGNVEKELRMAMVVIEEWRSVGQTLVMELGRISDAKLGEGVVMVDGPKKIRIVG